MAKAKKKVAKKATKKTEPMHKMPNGMMMTDSEMKKKMKKNKMMGY